MRGWRGVWIKTGQSVESIAAIPEKVKAALSGVCNMGQVRSQEEGGNGGGQALVL
ncbi:hypothetical protein PAMP_021083 [Pampus punctatissimus]